MLTSTCAATPSPSRTSPWEQVFGSDEAVVEQTRLLLGQHEHSPRPIGEAILLIASLLAASEGGTAHTARRTRTNRANFVNFHPTFLCGDNAQFELPSGDDHTDTVPRRCSGAASPSDDRFRRRAPQRDEQPSRLLFFDFDSSQAGTVWPAFSERP